MPKIFTFWWTKETIENFRSTSIYLFSYTNDLNLKKQMLKNLLEAEYLGIWKPYLTQDQIKIQEIQYIWKIYRIGSFLGCYDWNEIIFTEDSFSFLKWDKKNINDFILRLKQALKDQYVNFEKKEKWWNILEWAFIETDKKPVPCDAQDIFYKRKNIYNIYFEIWDNNQIVFNPDYLKDITLKISDKIIYYSKEKAYLLEDGTLIVPWWNTEDKNNFLTLFAKSESKTIAKIDIETSTWINASKINDFIKNMVRDDFINLLWIEKSKAKLIFKIRAWWITFSAIEN